MKSSEHCMCSHTYKKTVSRFHPALMFFILVLRPKPRLFRKKGKFILANRKRKIVLRVPVTDEERDLIYEKMNAAGVKLFSKYARRMLIDGNIINVDLKGILELNLHLSKIGTNINQLARKANSLNVVDRDVVNSLKDEYENLVKEISAKLESVIVSYNSYLDM